ncbi:MT-A70 family protein [Tritrichomonas foetus]|uniref:mRNA m(6)A methyltransferase n=1 Tax=Tritrichomonas foetus TaxID=1144522 RepID=A0A1J4KD52_9EUKA|nr:MT-A70 family protein [Tritrichomonas foetus]|eukprot:OHT09147.1 MT-A70 family protein [Tritrichomonas foetus]
MVENLRNKPRISYCELEYIEGLTSDSDEGYIYSMIDDNPSSKKGMKTISVDEDEWTMDSDFYDQSDSRLPRKLRAKNGTVIKNSLDQISLELKELNQKRRSKVGINQNILDEQCPFIPFSEVREKLLTQSLLFEDCGCFNTLIKDYDPVNPDKLPFFGFNGNHSLTGVQEIKEMKTEDIDKEISEIEEELRTLEHITLDNCIIVPPFDERLENSFSIKQDVLNFDWEGLGKAVQFDVILMDPPWKIQNTKITRGVEITYGQLTDEEIMSMPLHFVQSNGFVFMWVIASAYSNGLNILKQWGYEVINHINWIKTSRKGIFHPSHGYYVQHSKETLLVGVKGKGVSLIRPEKFYDVIDQPRNLRQSHKPDCLYNIIEEMFPGGTYLEIFARSHNLRENWISIGLELPP